MDELISVIVPVYNVAEYLDQCISSICNQTYLNLEIILVDDGSTDNSGKICNGYAARDHRVRVVHKENGGLVSARKAGLALASGEYIGFVDGDDYIEPDMYLELLKIICRENVDFVHSGHFKDNQPRIYGTDASNHVISDHNISVRLLRDFVVNPVGQGWIAQHICSKLFHRNVILEAYSQVPNDQSYGEDLICLCNCMLRGKSLYIVNKAFYHYITREGSICRTKSVDIITREGKLFDTLCDVFQRCGLLDKFYGALEQRYLRSVRNCIQYLDHGVCPIYYYPSMDELLGKKIVLYGMGAVGQDYYTQFRRDMRCTVLAVTDSQYQNYHYEYMTIIGPEEITKSSYDVIVIAVLSDETARSIQEYLVSLGVNKKRIIWKQPVTSI